MPQIAPAVLGRALARSAPVGLALFPVGVLFGLLAGQSGWKPAEVLLLGLLGFSASGQFAYLMLTSEQVRWSLIFAIILLMNLRYIPMSLTAARDLGGGVARRAFLAHVLSDESYAVELSSDDRQSRVIIRCSILASWVTSTVMGVALSGLLSGEIRAAVGRLSFFPASALLITLGLARVRGFVHQRARLGLWASVSSGLVALGFIAVLGQRYFWLPSTVTLSVVLYFIAYPESR